MATLIFGATNALGTAEGSVEITVGGSTRPPALFHSDWATALGTSDAAIRDTGKATPWTGNRDRGGNEVIATGTRDFPTTNIYKCTALWRPSPPGSMSQGPTFTNLIAIPAVDRVAVASCVGKTPLRRADLD